MAQTLDDFLPNILTQDTRKRVQCHGELVAYLQNYESSLYCEEMDKFIDGLSGWISSSNYKVSLSGLEVVSLLVERMGDHFKTHVASILPSVFARLGDNKDQVRESAEDVMVKLMGPTSPQYVFDRTMSAFSHKLWRVREEICICLHRALNDFGAKSLTLSKIVPSLVKLLEDQSIPVREQSVTTLVEIYRHVGERVRSDLTKKEINAQKMGLLMSKMDEMKNSGNMLATEDAARGGGDETDFAKPVGIPKTSSKRASSATSSATTTRRPMSGSKPPSSGSASSTGALDEDGFNKQFEEVPKIHLYNSKELAERIGRIKDMLSDPNHDWEKRVDALREVRSLMVAGALDYDEFYQLLRTLENSLQLSIKDLRSQVVREACLSCAYMSQLLGNKFDHFAEHVLPSLIQLIPNSVKIMASSGLICIKFIIQYNHAPRLIPIITGSIASKSKEIRRQCCDFLDQILHTWPTHTLEKHIAILQEAIKKGIGDADTDARAFSRKAFWGFADHFRDQADSLLNSLDASKQKLLQGEISHSSSNNSLSSQGASRLPAGATASAAATKSKSRSRSMSTERGAQLYSRTLTGTAAPTKRTTQAKTLAVDKPDGGFNSGSGIIRSSSAVDLAGVPSSGYGQQSVAPKNPPSAQASSNYNSLPRPKKTASSSTAQSILSPERSRPRSKIGVSQSQPSSRSGSPSSRLSYITHTHQQQQQPQQQQHQHQQLQQPSSVSASSRQQRKTTRIPRSQGASREASPSRMYGRERKSSLGSGLRQAGAAQRLPQNKTAGPGSSSIISQRTLPQGNDVEQAISDALALKASLRNRRYESYESDDAASETSSVCSERSYSSYGKTSEDMAEIITNLSSGSWADRKEGLIALQNLLRGNRMLNRLELKKITEIFTRMFHDPHGKVFSVFMETLVELIAVHRSDLHDWLYICLSRLISKMGADLLGSVQAKVQRALEAVRDSFPYDHQFNILTRYIVDQTQTPNLKVKVALMNYLHGLALVMDPSDFTNNSDTRLAVSRVITWTTEPKSVDVRKAAQAVLIAMFNLNTPEFTMMLSVLPKTFQDGATKILHNHLRSSSQESEVLSPRNVTSPSQPAFRYRPSPNRSNIEDVDTENMNPEEIYNSIKKTSADIQNLSKMDAQYDEIKKERDSTSQDSGIQDSMHDLRNGSPDAKDSPRSERRRQYNPTYYQDDSLNGYNKSALAEAVFDVENELFNEEFPGEQSDVVADILRELSNHNTRNEERTNAMLNLIKITREKTLDVWDEHFKTILLLLLETLGDSDGHIRALSLRVLREILKHQPNRFREYAELTILKILEAHKDTVKEVSRAAEECASTLACSISAAQCVRVLNPIIQTAEYPVNLAAIKMETKVLEMSEPEVVVECLQEVIPGIVKGYDNHESSVRKASVFCLVAVYLVIGEDLRPFIKDLNGSKMKLLNLYIKRALADRGQGGSTSTSMTTSPASTVADFGL